MFDTDDRADNLESDDRDYGHFDVASSLYDAAYGLDVKPATTKIEQTDKQSNSDQVDDSQKKEQEYARDIADKLNKAKDPKEFQEVVKELKNSTWDNDPYAVERMIATVNRINKNLEASNSGKRLCLHAGIDPSGPVDMQLTLYSNDAKVSLEPGKTTRPVAYVPWEGGGNHLDKGRWTSRSEIAAAEIGSWKPDGSFSAWGLENLSKQDIEEANSCLEGWKSPYRLKVQDGEVYIVDLKGNQMHDILGGPAKAKLKR